MDTAPEAALQPIEPTEPSIHIASAPERGGLFFGRFGMRAGWSIAIFMAVLIVIMTLGQVFGAAASGQLKAIMAARAQAQAHPNAPRPHIDMQLRPILPIVMDGIWITGTFAMCWLFSRAERRRLGVYGIGENRWKDIFPGAIWGIVIMSLLVGVLRATHVLVFDGLALHGGSIFLYGAEWLLAFLCVGLAEEYIFRGYIQYTLMRGVWGLAEKLSSSNPRPYAFWISATILSLLFLGVHGGNTGETHFGLFAVFVAGMTFAYTLWRTGSLWWAIGFHATWDWAQSFLYGVADSGNISVGRLFVTHPTGDPRLSGGSAGPEGSVFAIGALLLAVAAVHLISPGTQPAIEQDSLKTVAPHEAVAAS